MRTGRFLLCVFTLALSLWASLASASPAPPCSDICTPSTSCSKACSIWNGSTYTNVTCGAYGLCR
jgi:hypothetical protein